jgi:hypothetical protein
MRTGQHAVLIDQALDQLRVPGAILRERLVETDRNGERLTSAGRDLANELRREVVDRQLHQERMPQVGSKGDVSSQVAVALQRAQAGAVGHPLLEAYRRLAELFRDLTAVVETALNPDAASDSESAAVLSSVRPLWKYALD